MHAALRKPCAAPLRRSPTVSFASPGARVSGGGEWIRVRDSDYFGMGEGFAAATAMDVFDVGAGS